MSESRPLRPTSDEAPPTVGSALAGAAWAAALGALAGGGLDAVLAWVHFRGLPPTAVEDVRMDRWSDLAGGLAGAVSIHLVLQLALLLPLGMLAGTLGRRWLGRRTWRVAAAGIALTAAAFPLAYWHTRELLFYGLPATSTPRLAAAAGLLVLSAGVGLLLARLAADRAPAARRALGALSVALALGGLVWAAAHSRAAGERGRLNPRNADLPNVVLIVIDALRPDVLGCYGNATVRTPHIDALAAGGALFTEAYANAPFTGASFASFFTGQYPRRHGMLTMGPGVEIDAGPTFAELLDGARRTDGTAMQDGDVVAAAFMTGALSHGSGLMAGFDAYRELTLGHALVDLSNRWSVFRSELVPSILWSKLEARLDRDLLVHAARDWIAEREDRRFALFVHLYSTHTPYDPPEPFRSDYVDPDYDGPFEAFYAGHRVAIEQGDYSPTPEDVRRIYDLYLGGVALADHHVGQLTAELAALGLLEETLVIVTSDHGEDFGAGSDPTTGDPGRWEHNHMYRSNLRIPLVLHWPAGIPAGVRVDAPVEGVDLVPTILGAAGLEAPGAVGHGAEGHGAGDNGAGDPGPPDPRDVIDGQSLLPLVRGEREEHKPYLFAEDATYVAIHDADSMLTLERFAVAEDGWRVVLEEGLGSVRYHDFAQDPSGETDLFGDVVRGRDPSVASERNRARVLAEVERLRAALLAWNAGMPIDVETVVSSERDAETRSNRDAALAKRLAELGYAEGWDDYAGGLRDRVLELRAARTEGSEGAERADGGSGEPDGR